MFRAVSLKKIGALMCLGLMFLATPGWSGNIKWILPNSASRGLGNELILILAPAISAEWLCWLIEQKEALGSEGGESSLINICATDIYIAKPSVSD